MTQPSCSDPNPATSSRPRGAARWGRVAAPAMLGLAGLVGVAVMISGPGVAAAPGVTVTADSDGDGIPDPRDDCRYQAGLPPDGCPPRDRDGDQLLDPADDCPDQPGPIANRGCPDHDRDRDGVADRVDQCPDDFGRPASQGCLPSDRDGDGYLDHDDRCPERAEVWNRERDGDGCPDRGRSPIVLRDRHIRFDPPLGFVADETGLSAAGGRALKLAANVLVASRTLRVDVTVVAGYGRSYGDSLQHARRRADVIERWLAAIRALRAVEITVTTAPPDGDPRVELSYF